MVEAALEKIRQENTNSKKATDEEETNESKVQICEDIMVGTSTVRNSEEWKSDKRAEMPLKIRLHRVKPEQSTCNETAQLSSASSFEEDLDDSLNDPNFRDSSTSSSSSSESDSVDSDIQNSSAVLDSDISTKENKITKSRYANPDKWIKNKAATLRNSGKSYRSSHSKKNIRERQVRPPCGQKCRIKCPIKISEEQRAKIFEKYWGLEDLTRQRNFIFKSIVQVNPSYRYQKPGSRRRLNSSFHFEIDGEMIKVCKQFFKATLDINDRPIRTVITKNEMGFIDEDFRGKHGQHKKLAPEIKDGIRKHINSIPRIESHYLRQHTTREYIDGGKTIADLFRDYKADCKEQQKPSASLSTYTYLFNHEFNISFFVPKKDQCELCAGFMNADNEEKAILKEQYDKHQLEKQLSRIEKDKDKQKANGNYIVACYDLQAVLPAPRGDVSVFYYKSKINSFNFTISELNSDNVFCFFWHEGEGNRGAIEIDTCIFKYLEQLSVTSAQKQNPDIIFYSDNCAGQQKNKFTIAMYMHAVATFNIKSITHNFLIKGHTQNEGDNIHSVIEKAVKKSLRSGPIYVPHQYIPIIRGAKKTGKPYNLTELSYDDFVDFKNVCQHYGTNFQLTEDGEQIKMGEMKTIKVEKDKPGVFFVKTSYEQNEYKKIVVNNRKRKSQTQNSSCKLQQAYTKKQKISDRKISDINDLLKSNHIPKTYNSFYSSVFNI